VTRAHLRALLAPGRRSVLVLHDARLRVVDADTAFALATEADARVRCTRTEVRDSIAAAQPRSSGTTGRVTSQVARELTDTLKA